jgi:hypothetical protein
MSRSVPNLIFQACMCINGFSRQQIVPKFKIWLHDVINFYYLVKLILVFIHLTLTFHTERTIYRDLEKLINWQLAHNLQYVGWNQVSSFQSFLMKRAIRIFIF